MYNRKVINGDLINNDNTTTTDVASDNSQPSLFFDNKPDGEFYDDITTKFIFDLKAKTATDDATNVTESIPSDNKPDRKFDDDDSETDSQKQSHYYDDTYFLEQLKMHPRFQATLARKLTKLMIALFYLPRFIFLLLIIVL